MEKIKMTKEKGFTIATITFMGLVIWILMIVGFLITIAVVHLNPLPVQDVDAGYVSDWESDIIFTVIPTDHWESRGFPSVLLTCKELFAQLNNEGLLAQSKGNDCRYTN